MTSSDFGVDDFQSICAGAAILASGGGGSYQDAGTILQQLIDSGWSGTVPVQPYDGKTSACVIAMMGSPDAGDQLTLADIRNSAANTLAVLQKNTGYPVGCLVPVEIGAINSLVPLLAAAAAGLWVVDGDGAGRAVPELPQTTFGGAADLPVGPCALATDTSDPAAIESALLNSPTATQMEKLAGGVVGGFGGFSGIALWPSNPDNRFALTDNYIPGTLSQALALGRFLRGASTPAASTAVAEQIQRITQRATRVVVANYFITAITQSTNAASLDAGILRLDNTQDPASSTDTRFIYNMNENLVMYNTASTAPDVVAPDSICYYSEKTGRGFSNASDDLAQYFDAAKGVSTGWPVSVLQVATAPRLAAATGVIESFAGLLRSVGYAGQLPVR